MHFFLDPNFDPNEGVLSPDESRHALRVLRLREGERILIGDGKGTRFQADIDAVSNQEVKVKVLGTNTFPEPSSRISIAIGPTKNLSRFEWFLEKATELGVDEIIPLATGRTERQRIKEGRAEKIITAASKQSQRVFIPKLRPMTGLNELVESNTEGGFIAHCVEEKTRKPLGSISCENDTLILIGPEGDFTLDEVKLAEKEGFTGVTLSENRLRTETAGILAVAMLQMSRR